MRAVRMGLSRPGARRALLVYPLLAVLGTVLFFSLHYLGNLLPYELAEQRFRDEMATTNRLVTHPSYIGRSQWRDEHFMSPFVYCEQSVMVLAGALRDGEKPSFAQAVLPRVFGPEITGRGWHCTELLALLEGVPLPEKIQKTRYPWGSKALYAIGLNRLSVTGIHRLIEVASWVGWGVLAGALLLLGWRAFLVAIPVPLFGAFLSGIGYFSDIGVGPPYVWSLFAAAVFAWLLSRSRRRPPGTAISAFCFVAGMVSSWLWFFDGSEFMLTALFGLIGWFGSSCLEPRARFLRVTGFMALWVGGFVASFALILITRSFVLELFMLGEARDLIASADDSVARNLFDKVIFRLNGLAREFRAGPALSDPMKIPIVANYFRFEIMAMAQGIPRTGIRLIALLSLFSAMVAGGLALLRGVAGIRCRPDLLWLSGLIVIAGLPLVVPTDIPFLESRWVFLVLALCWSCLIAALTARAGASRRPAPHGSGGGRDAPAH